MGKVYSFEQARADKYAPPSYNAPEEVEIPEFVREAVDDQRAKQRRELLRVATKVIDSDDIPRTRELTDEEQPPAFD